MSTNISWTDETWNPTTGCSKVSAGCVNCYAARQAPRLAAMGQKGYTALPWTAKNAPENVMLHEDRLEKPLRWRKPRRVFVNSMSDLFHEQVPEAFIDKVFAVMALAPQHTFQILTKRPERMAAYFKWLDTRALMIEVAMGEIQTGIPAEKLGNVTPPPLPLENAWLGASVEDQRAADERIPHLLRTPAAVRFLSCEPLLGPVDLTAIPYGISHLGGGVTRPATGTCLEELFIFGSEAGSEADYERERVHWVIAGGESGPGFRPMDLDWPRSLRDQCVAAGVPFFFKQGSGFRPETNALLDGEKWRQFPVQEVKHG